MADTNQPVTASTNINSSGTQSSPSSTLTAVLVQNNQPSPSSDPVGVEGLLCEWRGCNHKRLATPNELYKHITEEHIGRKVTNNLTLNCAWGGCQVTTVKRDHITSHVRVHVPFKPHECKACRKRFKRPQDLKKHIKTHADDSVLSRIPDPFGGPRMRGSGSYHGRNGMTNDLQSLAATATGFYDHQAGSNGHQAFGQHGHTANTPYYGGGHHAYGSELFSSGQGGGPTHHAAPVGARKRGHDALNDFFGAVKRREINPASYGEVANSLMALHAVDLPVLGSTPMFQSTPPMVHAGGHDGSIGRQHPMPVFPNLRTKNDLLNMEHFLDQIQSTNYDSSNRVAVTGVSNAGMSSITRTGPQLGHGETSMETILTPSTVSRSTHSAPLTPPSSTSQRSGYSPASVNSDSVSIHASSPVPPSTISIYPNLPTIHSHGDTVGYSGSGTTPTSTIESAFHTDHRQRYSDQMLHKAARPEDPVNMGDVETEETRPKSKGMEMSPTLIDPALTALSAPTKLSGTIPATQVSSTDEGKQITSSAENLRIIQFIRKLVKSLLSENHDTEATEAQGTGEDVDVRMGEDGDVTKDTEEAESSVSSPAHHHTSTTSSPVPNVEMMDIEKDTQNLYPILRAVEGVH